MMPQKQATHEVMVNLGIFEERVVYASRKHPQVGYIHYHGEKHRVYMGFWGDCPVWTLVEDTFDEQEYDYCAHKTMPIDDDPDYCGEEAPAQEREPAAVTIQEIIITGNTL
jgi:hypothetical protein